MGNKNDYKQYKREKKKETRKTPTSFAIISILSIGVVCLFILFSNNKLGNDMRAKMGISSPFIKETNDYYATRANAIYENDIFYENTSRDESGYSSSGFNENDEIQSMIEQGQIITVTPNPQKDLIVTVDENGHIISSEVKREDTPSSNSNVQPTPTTMQPQPTLQENESESGNGNPNTKTPPQSVPPIVVTQVVTPIVEQPSTPQQATTPQTQTPSYSINQDAYNNATTMANQYQTLVSDFLVEINNLREENGLNPVTLDETLCQVAGYRVYDMGTNVYFSHDLNGVNQIDVAAYVFNRQSIKHYENLGRAKNTEESRVVTLIVDGWKNSEGHYKVIKMESLKTVGIAINRDSEGTWYVCTVYCS